VVVLGDNDQTHTASAIICLQRNKQLSYTSLLSFVLSAASLQLHRLQKFTSPIPSVVEAGVLLCES
jgi:hypothetical protein